MATRDGGMEVHKATSVDSLSCELTWEHGSLRVCHEMALLGSAVSLLTGRAAERW